MRKPYGIGAGGWIRERDDSGRYIHRKGECEVFRTEEGDWGAWCPRKSDGVWQCVRRERTGKACRDWFDDFMKCQEIVAERMNEVAKEGCGVNWTKEERDNLPPIYRKGDYEVYALNSDESAGWIIQKGIYMMGIHKTSTEAIWRVDEMMRQSK